MTNDVQTTVVPAFRDRKAGLIAFGIVLILYGVLCLLMVPVMLFSLSAASSLKAGSVAPMTAGTMISAVLVYVLEAAWFIGLGIGSILARRWARALLLITSWYGFIFGILTLGFILLFLPTLYDSLSANGQMSRQMVSVMQYVMIGLMVVFCIIMPGLFVLFYGSRHVKATCEYRDPHVRWTDQCPLPVLAVSLMAGFMVLCLPMMGAYGWAVPFFGTILSGAKGGAVILVTMVLLGYVSRGLYQLNMKAWWGALILVIVWGATCGITFSRVKLMDFYSAMNRPSQELEMMKPFTVSLESKMVPFCALWMLVALAYLFYIHRYLAARVGRLPVGDEPSRVVPLQPSAPPLPMAKAQAGAPSGGGGLAIASLVLGVMAVCLGIFVIGGVLGIIGLILGIIHLARNRSHRLLAGCGVGLSILGCVLASAILGVCFSSLKSIRSMSRMTHQERYTQSVRELSDPATPEIKRFYALNGAAKDAFNLGKTEEARAYAEELSRILERFKDNWNYGNAVQDSNLVLGRIAVSEGDLVKAKDYLRKAGDSPGSPQMNSFGPNMSLAKDLLEQNEKQAVLHYFKQCAKFWKMDDGKLNAWAKEVESGQIPDFGANLVY
jgi:hypothetical protein